MLPKALAYHLASLGLARYDTAGPSGAAQAYVIDMPDTPHTALCIAPRPSFPPDNDLSGYDWPELGVVIRTDKTAGHQAGWDLAEAIRRALKDTAHITWAAGSEHEQHVFSCDANESAPLALEPSNGRPRWSVSFQIHALQEVSP